jgi:hypothetical protein
MSRSSLHRALYLLAAAALAAVATPAAAGACCACAASCGSYGPVQDIQVRAYEVRAYDVQRWEPPIQRYMVPQGPDYSGNGLTGEPTIDAAATPLDYPYVGFYSYPVRRGFRPYGGPYRADPRRAGLLERRAR